MDDRPEQLTREPWETGGAEALVRLLTQPKLRELAGDLESALRTHRYETTGKDRPSTKEQLAAALVIQHGRDLLADPEIRKVVAKAAKIPYLGRWHPGKDGPWEFVEAAGFPGEFAGQAGDRPPDDELDLEAAPRLPPLEDFQVEVRDRALALLRPGKGRALVSLPTGAGKTRVAVEVIRQLLTGRTRPTVVVWLAQSEELCEQAVECFEEVWQGGRSAPPVRLVRLWGSYSKDRSHRLPAGHYRQRPNVVVSTPQRYANELAQGPTRERGQAHPVTAALLPNTRLLVIDEAHRAAAPTYRALLADLTSRAPEVSVLGLTATPFRLEYDPDRPLAGTEELRELFQNLLVPETTLTRGVRTELQERGVLARPRLELVPTGVRLPVPDPGSRGRADPDSIARIDEELCAAADQPRRRRAVLKALLPLARQPDASILYFGPRVVDAASIAYLLRSEGIAAAFISGETKAATRKRLVEDFREGRLRVLCNCEVLTTGFDAPRVTHVFVARPTVSGVLYQQMVGRGLRGPRFGGTEVAHLLDCEDGFSGSRRGLKLGFEEFREVWGI